MIRKQLLIGILAAMTVALPAVGIYAVSAEAVSYTHLTLPTTNLV